MPGELYFLREIQWKHQDRLSCHLSLPKPPCLPGTVEALFSEQYESSGLSEGLKCLCFSHGQLRLQHSKQAQGISPFIFGLTVSCEKRLLTLLLRPRSVAEVSSFWVGK